MATARRQRTRLRGRFGHGDTPLVSPLARPVLWASLFAVVIAVAWAAWAELDEVTRGDGQVVPFSRVQIIQSLEGGILDRLLVAEGDVVTAGQPLVQLDAVRFRTGFGEARARARALQAAVARLEAEVRGAEAIEFPGTIEEDDPVIASETSLFRARRARLNEAVAALEQEIALARRQLALIEPLVARRSVSEVEQLKLRQQIAAKTGELTEMRNAYMQEAYGELVQRQSELAAELQVLEQRRDQLDRTRLISPVNGRVNAVHISTRGGVVQPGEAIMEITPGDDQLLVEARIRPKDVAFIAPGMPARVKITAYDYTIYGDLPATVEQISADTIEEETPRGKEAFYRILVRTERAHLVRGGNELPIRPGMVAEVDVISGQRSVLSYLLRPLLRARLN
ncbi:HlyD family efflux transporter periplasmic adaptor subunit [Coralloluteibacterium stylophorae]|uniref:HlyD family efflux transporter periplasmic adaptor subunit n=2 Tax=Coralloluteibacterium stylophorae TaxID=1776034 RepID=A0AAP2CBM6_9GAMM|nr:HlyD family efflux transporter periplasmic adaptor subunit [Coralloluteibacterium stylophorae]MBS7457399.1 HlyD family efflux transporter periplasmic adaptor subunit [Coralloluteibacterium stylophorae]